MTATTPTGSAPTGEPSIGQPPLADRTALDRARLRARSDALFLHRAAAVEVKERLTDVNRAFTSPAVVTGQPDFWRIAMPDARVVPDDDMLALDPGAHDLVVHALALHWATDVVGQLVQCRRALRPDGLFLGLTLAGRTLDTLRDALARAEVAATGGLSPRVVPMADMRDLGWLLQRAGFALPVTDSLAIAARYADPLALCRDLRAMGEVNALAARDRRIPPRDLFARMAMAYPTDPDGRISATFEMVVLTGWAPADNQPKPLRPGSAITRLSDALGAATTRRNVDPVSKSVI